MAWEPGAYCIWSFMFSLLDPPTTVLKELVSWCVA